MKEKNILKDSEFEEVGETKTDSKNRVALGRGVKVKAYFYKIYQNSLGQIVLDPQVTVPAHEAWLFQNPKAIHMVREGLEDAKQGKLVKAKEDYSKHI